MKKILVMVMIVAFAGMASADQMNTGCGLGTMLLGKSGDTKLMQILITCTNGTSTNQSTGITLDVQAFGCKPTRQWVQNSGYAEFVQGNIDNIVRDVAMGSGDTISTMASMLEVSDADAFAANLQTNFAVIFPSADVEYAQVADSIFVVSQL